jgi:hypothetical protein
MGRKEILTVLPELERWLYWLARKVKPGSDTRDMLNRYARAVNCAMAKLIADWLMEDDGK